MVLIVDDKAENIFSLKRTLELSGFEVDAAGSGEEALKKILKTQYSLIILDVQMPGMDGFEVAEAISGFSKAKDIPIIFLSAVNVEKRFVTKGYAAGAVDYVTKPVDPDIFTYKVKTLHALHEQNRALKEMKISLMEEIETRKRTELALHQALGDLKSVMESMPQVTFTIRADKQIEYVNEHWYLYSDSMTTLPTFYDNGVGTSKWNAAFDTEEVITEEVQIKHIPSGDYRYHLLRIIPIKHEGKLQKWVGTFTDIHMQKVANDLLESKVRERTEELLSKNRELEISNHELQQFASVASHDLKEPLRKIQVFSTVIKERYMNGTEGATDSIDRVIEAASRMSGLINDLLNYSRLSVENAFQPTDLNQVISDIICDLELQINEKNAKITCTKIPIIDAVEGQMRQVFQNLLSNSLKFTPPGVAAEISISATLVSELSFHSPQTADGRYCRITVSDNGIGFDEIYLEKVFTIFQRLNKREQYEGTGIGLAIVRKILDKHRSIITARSKPNEGAAFIMILPVKQQQSS